MTAKLRPDDLEFLPLDQIEDRPCLRRFRVARPDRSFDQAYDTLDAWLMSDEALRLHRLLQIRTVVAFLEGEPVGYIAVHAHAINPGDHAVRKELDAKGVVQPFSALRVAHLATAAAHAGRGIADNLMYAHAIGVGAFWTTLAGCRFIYLDALRPAIGYYRRLQFVPIVPEERTSKPSVPMVYDLARAPEATRALGEAAARQLLPR